MSDSESDNDDNQINFYDFPDKISQNCNLSCIFSSKRRLGAVNHKPLLTAIKRDWNYGNTKNNIIEVFDGPITTFERLWECCCALHYLVKTGLERKEKSENKKEDCDEDCLCEECEIIRDPERYRQMMDIQHDSVTAFSEFLSSYVLDLASYWHTWSNNTLIGYLQKLIPFSLPPLIWKKITSYLTDDSYFALILEVGTISKTEKVQVLEKSLLQECILLCCELVKMFGLVLYTSNTRENIKYLSASISKTMQLFSSAMMRLDSLLNPENSSSKVLNMSMKNESSGLVDDVVGAFNSKSQDCMFFVMSFICANDEFENNSPYFVWLEKGSNSKKIYRLIYAKKDILASRDRKDIIKMKTPGNFITIFSDERPVVHCSGSIMAVVTSEETEQGKLRRFLWVWDLEVSPDQEIYKYKLDRLTAVYNKRGMATVGIFAVGNVGLSKKGTLLSVVVDMRFKLAEKDSKSVCMFVLTYDTQNFGKEKAAPKPKTMLADAMSIGVHKNYVFSIRIGVDTMLILQDLDKNLKPLTMVEWNKDNPWEVRFNCNPEKNTCILYRKNEIQLRKLDDNLTFIRDITLIFEGCSPLRDPCYQFFNETLYGLRRYQIQESMVENRYAKIVNNDIDSAEEVHALFSRAFHEYDEQFVIDLAEENIEPIYFETARPIRKFTRPNDPSCVTYKVSFTGFSPSGDLQQITFTSFKNDCSYDQFGETGLYSGCHSASVVTVRFYNSPQNLFVDSISDIDMLLGEYSETLAKIDRDEEERNKKIKEMERKIVEAESKRKELESTIAGLKAKNSNKGKRRKFTRGMFTDVPERKERAMKYINDGTRFDCILTSWSKADYYGFGDIVIEDYVESVFVHGSSLLNAKGHVALCRGSLVQFRIEWDLNKPRPKAVDTMIDRPFEPI